MKQVADPDVIKTIPVDRYTLPQGDDQDLGYETRQVIDLDISTAVIEWRAQILENQNGKRYVTVTIRHRRQGQRNNLHIPSINTVTMLLTAEGVTPSRCCKRDWIEVV